MTRRAPRPRLREGVGEARRPGHGLEDGRRIDLLAYDPPFKLSGRGLLQWQQFAADPMPWWSDADLPTIAQYCAAISKLTPGMGANGWALVSRELRQLSDALGLNPMARARLKLGKGPVAGASADQPADTDGEEAEVIPIGDLVDGDGKPK